MFETNEPARRCEMFKLGRPPRRSILNFLPSIIRICFGFRISDFGFRLVPIAAALLFCATAFAFPPAPYHTIYGLVRDEYGQPLYVTGAQIIFEATNGVQITGTIVPGLDLGINYRLNLPMDSGIAPDNYKPTALKPTLPFVIRVKIGNTTYLPMELSGSYANLGKPAQSTRLDLTLGVDADHDGLPDAWQQLIKLMLGPNALTGPNDDPDGDGLTNLQEYQLGTYAFVPDDGFRLKLVSQPGAKPLVEFAVTTPHTYTVLSSTNLQSWSPTFFRIPANGPADAFRPYYTATDIRILQVEPQLPTNATNANYFFRLQVQ
jgi:hypothetical protein